MKEQALDLEFFWVSEKGPNEYSKITSGMSVRPTVRSLASVSRLS